MKRTVSLLLVLAIVFTLAACGESVPAQESTAPASGPVAAATVDELLAAIAPGAEIQLAPGEYCLSDAADYGSSQSPYYTWHDLGLGEYELQLINMENITITGTGKGQTTLITEPRWANVMTLMNCKSITLENMTMGHTVMTEACEGGVLRAEGSEAVTLKGLGLYGCGTLGLLAFECKQVLMENCEFYDCSIGGLQVTNCQDVRVADSQFHDLGKEFPVMEVFSFSNNEEVLVENCSIYDNYTEYFVFGGGDASFRHNQFTSNRISIAAFYYPTAGLVLDDNVFDQNELRNWYTQNSIPGVDAQGNPVPFESPAVETGPVTPGVAVPVTEAEQKEVRVTNVDDFLAAIAPDTCIILDADFLDLSTAQSYQNALKEYGTNNEYRATYSEEYHPYCYWQNNYDGPSLIITGVKNLTIKAEGDDRTSHTISAVPRYADVLTFENCEDITLSGFTAGHTIEPGQCTGGVFLLRNCEDVLIENCGMYGCGTEGVNGENSRNIQVVNSEIYECSYSGIVLSNCENVAISGTVIRDIRNDWEGNAPHFMFYDSRNVTLDGKPLDGNYKGS